MRQDQTQSASVKYRTDEQWLENVHRLKKGAKSTRDVSVNFLHLATDTPGNASNITTG